MIFNLYENGFSNPTVNSSTWKKPPFADSHYAIPTVHFKEHAYRLKFDVDAPNCLHSILGHLHTFCDKVHVIYFKFCDTNKYLYCILKLYLETNSSPMRWYMGLKNIWLLYRGHNFFSMWLTVDWSNDNRRIRDCRSCTWW